MDTRINDSKVLAETVQKYLAEEEGQKNRGISRGGFAMVNCEAMRTKASN